MAEEREEQLSEEELARRRDEVVKRMLATPPQPKRTNPKNRNPDGDRRQGFHIGFI